MPNSPTVPMFGQAVRQVAPSEVAETIEAFCTKQHQIALFCNVHMLMLALEDKTLAKAMASADYVFADGEPVSWLQRRLTGNPAATVAGFTVMAGVFRHALNLGESVGFLGATSETLEAIKQNICKQFPELRIGYCYSPPFSDDEVIMSERELAQIESAGIAYLFVGLGCPKQEKWILRYAAALSCSLLGVGAELDWLAGNTRKPPDWMKKVGLAWLFRLIQNPRKMWHRYLIYNSKFILKASKLLVDNAKSSRSGKP